MEMTKVTPITGPDRLLFIRGEWVIAAEPHASRLTREATKVMIQGDPAFEAFIEQRRREVIESQSAPMRKFREALIVSDIPLSEVTAAIETIPDPKQKALVKNYWETETRVRFQDVHMQKIRELLSLNLETLFKTTLTL